MLGLCSCTDKQIEDIPENNPIQDQTKDELDSSDSSENTDEEIKENENEGSSDKVYDDDIDWGPLT